MWWSGSFERNGGCIGLVFVVEIMMLSCLWRQNAMVFDLEAECRGRGGNGW